MCRYLPRREDPHHRRGHRRGPADGDRPRAGRLSAEAVSRGLGPALRGLRRDARPPRVRQRPLRRRRAAPPARRALDRGRRRRRPRQPVRAAPVRRVRIRYRLDPHGHATAGGWTSRRASASRCCIAPAYAPAGRAACSSSWPRWPRSAFVLAVALARRMVPEPWATAGPLVCALSPPALAYSTAVEPPLVAGTVLAGAAVLRAAGAGTSEAAAGPGRGLLLALLPWLGTQYAGGGDPDRGGAGLVDGAPAPAAGSRSWRLEVVLASLVVFATVNERLYGGLVPEGAGAPLTGASNAGDYVDRAYRLAGAVARPRLRPAALGAGPGAGASWPCGCCGARGATSSRGVVTDQRDVEAAGLLLVLVGAAQVIVAFVAPTMFGFWFPGYYAGRRRCRARRRWSRWALRHVPRWVSAALAAITLVGQRVALRGPAGGRRGLGAADLAGAVGAARGRVPEVRHVVRPTRPWSPCSWCSACSRWS